MNSEDCYDWYEEDFTAFLLSLDLPAYRKDTPTRIALINEKASFAEKFSEMISKCRFRSFSDKFYSNISAQLPQIKRNFDLLCEIIDFYDSADLASAQKQFNMLMDSLVDQLFISNIYWPKLPTTFFRVRAAKSEVLKKPKDLFHIPYSKRHLVSNERYSMAGHPCLYLASHLQIAWQECGYPHQYYYSEFMYQRSPIPEDNWKFITFLSPREVATMWFVAKNEEEDYYIDLTRKYLSTYPLIFACSVVNLNGHSAFKQEFVIPQMLMQWVYRNYDSVKGIKYFSCYNADDICHYNGYNIVLPAKINDRRKSYSEDLIQKFKVSKPSLIENKLSEREGDIVRAYKDKVIKYMHDAFFEAGDCLCVIYDVADILDKSIRNMDTTDMQLLISTIRNIRSSGRLTLEKYKKEDIIANGRQSITYTSRTESRITLFSEIYDGFQSNVIDIAESFLYAIDRIPHHTPEEFYTI